MSDDAAAEASELLAVLRSVALAVTIEVMRARVVAAVVGRVVVGRVVSASVEVSSSVEEKDVEVDVLSIVVVMTATLDEVSDVLVLVSEVVVSVSSMGVVVVSLAGSLMGVRVRETDAVCCDWL